jgi:DtxR family Mn-dependent transcriptional regulator
MGLTFTEENYLKAIYHLSGGGSQTVSTNAVAEALDTKAASVSDMLKKLAAKHVVHYEKYQGVNVTDSGKVHALKVIRKHRLWEVFLVDKLKFSWDEVHEVAEHLEHIQSPLLIRRLDEFLNFPKYDPHGDPIPDENGEFNQKPRIPLNDLAANASGTVVSVKDSSKPFLQYLDKLGLQIGSRIKVIEKVAYDQSMEIIIDNRKTAFLSREVSENILIND